MTHIKSNYLNQFHLIFILLFSFSSFSQLKRMSVGLEYGTNNFSNNYISSGLTFQYNFNRIFSLRSGVDLEQGQAYYTMEHASMPPIYYSYYDISPQYINIPILGRASFGKRFSFFINGGLNMSFSKKSLFSKSVDYNSNADYEDYSVKGEDFFGKKNRMNIIYGIGIIVPFKRKFLISFEIRETVFSGIFVDDLDNDFNEDDHNYHYDSLRDIHNFYRSKFLIGVAYNFDLKK